LILRGFFLYFYNQMSKKRLLVDFDYDFTLIGISSHNKDYRLSYEINKALNTNLSKKEDVDFTKKGDKIGFSMYFFQDEMYEKDIRLLSNKKNGRILIPEQKLVDYFLILYDFDFIEVKEILEKLKNINAILTVFQIEVSTLKSKECLLF